MAFRDCLSFVVLSEDCFLTIPLFDWFAIHLQKLLRKVTRYFPLVCVKFDELSSLVMCSRNFRLLFLILNIRVLFISTKLLLCIPTQLMVHSASLDEEVYLCLLFNCDVFQINIFFQLLICIVVLIFEIHALFMNF